LEQALRIYLAGRVAIEAPDGRIANQAAFAGRQGRLAFAYLVLRHRPVTREELVDLLWGEALPPSWDAALSAVISRLRGMLGSIGASRQAIVSTLGTYEIRLPAGTWIDIEAAARATHEAEAALQVSDQRAAWGAASVAYHIARRPFLPGEEGPWVEQQRAHLAALHVRAAECLATVSLRNDEPSLAAVLAEEVVRQEPFRETGYQLLMRAHAAAGSRAQALLTYERCRRLLADELGTDPSPETQALHLQILADP
jgi:DNA-binding SARP family transcriptional activator